MKRPSGDQDGLQFTVPACVSFWRVPSARRIQIWVDPSRSYLPLRVLVVQKDGTRIDQVATRVTVP